jgi:endonuclease YncB( thermonuclease family)
MTPPTYRRTRPLWRTLADALVFAVVLAMVSFALDYFGVLSIGPGRYRVIDGDSLRNGELELRLFGIDAPEAKQTCNDGRGAPYDCGKDATRALSQLVSGKTVKCRKRDIDRYGRTVAVCEADGLEINREMVRLGWAVAYDRHSFAYVLAERDARNAQRGIWYGDFERPEDYRARQASTHGSVLAAGHADDSPVIKTIDRTNGLEKQLDADR